MPSLHAAYPVMLLLFFWGAGAAVRAGLALYAVAMAFTLVYTGEHFVLDILVGWAMTGAVYALVAAALRAGAACLAAARLRVSGTPALASSRPGRHDRSRPPDRGERETMTPAPPSPHDRSRTDVDVLIVGAGISGIGAAYHLATRTPGQTLRDPRGPRRDRRHVGPVPLPGHPLGLRPVHVRVRLQAVDVGQVDRRRPTSILDYLHETVAEHDLEPAHPLRPSRHRRAMVVRRRALDGRRARAPTARASS